MQWFPDRNPIRLDFENLGFRPQSVISLGLLYNQENYKDVYDKFGFHISRYAMGEDYHSVIRHKLNPVLAALKNKFPEFRFRAATDTLPLAEKVLARQSGIGWQGKNTNIINSRIGSFFFLSEILTDMPIEPDQAAKDRCGKCQKCMDACPTGALFEPYKIDAGKCISHATIEDRCEFMHLDTHGWIYGCDICQSVCPWNEKAEKMRRFTGETRFFISDFFLQHTEDEIIHLDETLFAGSFEKSAIKRISHDQFKRNIRNYLAKGATKPA